MEFARAMLVAMALLCPVGRNNVFEVPMSQWSLSLISESPHLADKLMKHESKSQRSDHCTDHRTYSNQFQQEPGLHAFHPLMQGETEGLKEALNAGIVEAFR
jgi:hypothetical protein